MMHARNFTLLLLLLFASSVPCFAQLSGTYTIDAVSSASVSNYKSFASAIGDLTTGKRTDGGPASGKGVSGPVTFNVSKGTYNEQMLFTAINGATMTNTITFQSATGDSTSVTVNNTTINNYVVSLKGASYIRIRKMTFKNTGSTGCTMLRVEGGSCNNIFSNNHLIGKNSSISPLFGLITSPGDEDTGNTYQNNYMVYGGYGFYLSGTSYLESGTKILDNIMDSMGVGIQVDSQQSIIIKGNKIRTKYMRSTGGINLQYCFGGSRVEGNTVYLQQDGYGVFAVQGLNGTVSRPAIVANNCISIGNQFSITSSSVIRGIFSYDGSHQVLSNNNIYIYADINTAPGDAIRLEGVNNQVSIFNNNIKNTGGPAISNSNSIIVASDHNNFTTDGSVLISSGRNYTTLADWQMATAMDSYSYSVNPYFYSKKDLHTRSVSINGAGMPLNFIKQDIDGQPRDPKTPDIGADEFTPLKLDAGIAFIDAPLASFCNSQVVVRIRNFGSDTIKNLKIGWDVNGTVQTSYSWTGRVLPDSVSAAITIGSYAFAAPNSYSLKVYTTLPNGGTDGLNTNDTIFKSGLLAGISGNYTIGGTSPDYTTINAALKDVTSKGVCGPVVFNIRDGKYSEKLFVTAIPGASVTNTITFQSASGDSSKVILDVPTSSTDYAGSYVISLRGASYLHFNKLYLRRTGALDFATLIRIDGGSCNNVFYHNLIKGAIAKRPADGMYYRSTQSLIWADFGNLPDTGNQFIGNHFYYGSNGFYYVGNYVNNASVYEGGTVLDGNILDSASGCAILMAFQKNLKIRNNKITRLGFVNSFGYHGAGIYLQQCSGTEEITHNYVDVSDGGNGIELYVNEGTDTALIANNFVHVGGNNSHSFVSNGLSVYYGINLNFYDNNISVDNTNANAALFTGAYRSYNLFGNIFSNIGGGYAIYANSSAIGLSDNNNFHTAGSSIGNFGGVKTYNLADWQSASSLDANSSSTNPYYKSLLDLHVSSPLLDGNGIRLPGIINDFDKESRSSKPDLGADEFTPLSLDAGVSAIDTPNPGICPGSNRIIIRIKNYGSNTLTTLKINWEVNGAAQKTFNWRGKLVAGSEDTVYLGTYSFTKGNSYDLKFYTTSPNGSTDGNFLNDTFAKSGIKDAMNGTYTIGGTTPDYNTFKDAVSDLDSHGICGPVIFNVRDGSYSEQISIHAIPGASSINTVLFQSQSGDSTKVSLISASTASVVKNYTLDLDGASWISFRKMTIQRTGSGTYGVVVEVHGSSSHITFSNNRITGVSTTSQTETQSVIHSAKDIDSFITVNNNRITQGAYGMFWYGSGQLVAEPGTVISYNQFNGQGCTGIHMGFQDAPLILGNSITNITGLSIYAIHMYEPSVNGIRILKNYIYLPNGGNGIYSNNGMYASATDSAVIANNFISIGGSAGGFGIYTFLGSYMNFYNNSIYVTATNNNWTLGAYFNMGITIKLINNNFIMKGTAKAIRTYLLGAPLAYMDYNNYYTKGTILGDQTNVYASNISDWQSATGMEWHSISADPGYVSATDLHLTKNTCSRKGLTLATVTDDYDGDIRKAVNCDIGADEFPPPAHDAEMLGLISPDRYACGDSFSRFGVVISNPGGTAESNIPVSLSINGATTLTATYAGPLAPGAKDTVWFSTTYNTWSGGKYNLKFWTSLGSDMDATNDTKYDTLTITPYPTLLSANGAGLCKAGSVTLRAKAAAGQKIEWYDSNSPSAPILSTADSFVTPILSTGRNYYAAAVNKRVYKAAPVNTSFGYSSKFDNVTEGCVFDAAADLTIDSVTIYPDGSGPVWIELHDAAGKLLALDTFNVSVSGKYPKVRVGLFDFISGKAGFHVSKGYGYQLIFDASNSGVRLTMNYLGSLPKVRYPMKNKEGLITIIHSTYVGTLGYNTNRFYYFYDWKFSIPSCTGPKTAVPVNIIPLIAGFKSSNLCVQRAIQFTDTSKGSATATSWAWDFGDGFTSIATNPVHAYTKTGSYTASLKLANSSCNDSTRQLLKINSLPDSAWVVTNYDSLNKHLRFSPKDSFASGNTYLWNFGDAGTSGLMQPWHIYLLKKKYQVSLKVTSSAGCEASFLDSILVDTMHYTALKQNFAAFTSAHVGPNPCKESSVLYLNLNSAVESVIKIQTIEGKDLMIIRKGLIPSGEHEIPLQINGIPAGSYFLKLRIEGQEKVLPLIKL